MDLADHVGPLLVVDSYRETGLTRYNQKRYFASRPTPILEATLPDGPHRIFVSVQAEVTHHKYWGHFADVLNPEAVAEFIRPDARTLPEALRREVRQEHPLDLRG